MLSDLSVVIPVYRGAATLEILAQRLGAVLDGSCEVIFVDDGSPDASWSVLVKIIEEHPNWTGLQLGRNSGQHNALLAGIRASARPVIVTMDDDLQHRPEEIPLLVACLDEPTDLVYGVSIVEEHGFVRSLLSRSVKRTLQSVLGAQHANSLSAFRCFRAHLREGFAEVNDPYISIDVLLSWATTKVRAAEVTMDARTIGESNYTRRALVRYGFNLITGYSVIPLRMVAVAGSVFGLLGFVSLGYVLARYVLGDVDVPGFTFLAAMLSLVGGVLMIGLAVIGEYVGRVHFRAMRRPSYYIRTALGSGANSDTSNVGESVSPMGRRALDQPPSLE